MTPKRLKIVFSKSGDMRFVSHLDLVRLFQRASRRAGLPVSVTGGFSPHLKISITRALKLGLASSNEEAVFYMDECVEPDFFKKAINEKMPEGVRVDKVEEIL